MKSILLRISAPSLAAIALSSCVIEAPSSGSTTAPRPPRPPGSATQLPGSVPGFSQPLTAIPGPGSVTIREGSRTLCSFRTARPNVEQTRWYSEQEQIVVKSRGSHGPAVVQLFDSRTGRQIGQVMAYDIRGGQPRWAAGMGE